MLRGTNRSIIEISETDHKYFERVLIFVKPEFGYLPISKLEKEATRYVREMNPKPVGTNRYSTARSRVAARKRKRITLFGAAAVIITATVLCILKIL